MPSTVQLKDGVMIVGNYYINLIIKAAQIAMRDTCDVIITAGRDGQHGTTSYHYQDRALDLRFWHIDPDKREQIADAIRAILPSYFDVVMEKDHYHIEADAKKELEQKGILT